LRDNGNRLRRRDVESRRHFETELLHAKTLNDFID
jgi:hypothetical protein